MKTVLEYYKQAIDKDNPLRQTMYIDESMHGRFANTMESYDMMDNGKYKDIEGILDIMRETFGYHEDLSGLIKTSLTEANFMLAKKSVDLKKMMMEGAKFQDSLDSETPMNMDRGTGELRFG